MPRHIIDCVERPKDNDTCSEGTRFSGGPSGHSEQQKAQHQEREQRNARHPDTHKQLKIGVLERNVRDCIEDALRCEPTAPEPSVVFSRMQRLLKADVPRLA